MTRPTSENLRWYGMVLGLAVVLVLLALLQYRSSKAVSEATRQQMRASLQGSLMDVRLGLERELMPLGRNLQLDSPGHHPQAWQEYALAFDRWFHAADHPQLVSDLFIFQLNPGQRPNLLKLNSNRTGFETSDWPDNLGRLREYLTASVPPFPGTAGFRGGAMDNGAHRDMPDHPDSVRSHFPGQGPTQDQFGRWPGAPPPGQGLGNPPLSEGSPGISWVIDQDVPALVHLARGVPHPNSKGQMEPQPAWIIVVLNRNVLGQEILPELVQRYFGRTDQSSYEIVVTGADEQQPDLYRSNPALGRQQLSEPDAELNLFGRPAPIVAGRRPELGRGGLPGDSRPQLTPNQDASVRVPFVDHDGGPFRIDLARYDRGDRGWEILAKHHEGSVEAAVAALFRRNLMFSFAVLAVLAATMAMIIIASQRARRLGQLQMDFVANVSHELRTPLTGILSAAQNIADGVIDDRDRVSLYGKAIIGQADQLTELVEQILLFSGTQKGRYAYHFEPVDVAEVIETSLKNTAGLVRSAGVTIDQQIQSGLPQVWGDRRALSLCLQNLIGNAVKYGGDARWVGIQASGANDNGKKEVSISVSDKGIGITRKDIDQVFEPFYRSPAVTAAQIHGTGLGLPLARSVAEAMGGRITVESEYGKGSTFTLHLPIK